VETRAEAIGLIDLKEVVEVGARKRTKTLTTFFVMNDKTPVD
jgi:hypothetical protein